jgi:hypothetical protein
VTRWLPFLGIVTLTADEARAADLPLGPAWRWRGFAFEWLDFGVLFWVWAVDDEPDGLA